MRRRPLCKTLIIVEQVGAQGWQEEAEVREGTCRRYSAGGKWQGTRIVFCVAPTTTPKGDENLKLAYFLLFYDHSSYAVLAPVPSPAVPKGPRLLIMTNAKILPMCVAMLVHVCVCECVLPAWVLLPWY